MVNNKGADKRSGRPSHSEIRNNIIEILYFLGKAHGYEIYKIYREIFPKCTQRVVYYHLNQGVKLNLFEVDKIVKEEGDFSWGSHAEKVYYTLGRNAFPKIDERVKVFLEKKNSNSDLNPNPHFNPNSNSKF